MDLDVVNIHKNIKIHRVTSTRQWIHLTPEKLNCFQDKIFINAKKKRINHKTFQLISIRIKKLVRIEFICADG